MQNYKIIKKLGIGSFAYVSLALHNPTSEKVAIKTIPKCNLTKKQDILLVNKQISICKSVNHGNLVKLYQILEDHENLYLVMEFVEDGDLLDYIKQKGVIPEDKALRFAWQILNALQYLHKEKAIAHRDIKLANILVSSGGEDIKLADFGLSNFYDKNIPFLQTSCGSPCYSAPEVLKGKKYNPLFADIWSFGVVLYSIVEGVLPFFNQNVKQLCRIVTRGRYPSPQKCSNELKSLIKRILDVNPDLRLSINQLKFEVLNLISKKQKERNNKLSTNHMLTQQSNDYINELKIQKIKEILKQRGFLQKDIDSAFCYRKDHQRAEKFNQLNVFIQLLSKKPFLKLKELLKDSDETISSRYLTESRDTKLKRTQSNFTRDTAKNSPRQMMKKDNPKFVRNNNQSRQNKITIDLQQENGNDDEGQKIKIHMIRKRKKSEPKQIKLDIFQRSQQGNKIHNAYIKLKSTDKNRLSGRNLGRKNISCEKLRSAHSPLNMSLTLNQEQTIKKGKFYRVPFSLCQSTDFNFAKQTNIMKIIKMDDISNYLRSK